MTNTYDMTFKKMQTPTRYNININRKNNILLKRMYL